MYMCTAVHVNIFTVCEDENKYNLITYYQFLCMIWLIPFYLH